MGVVVPLTNAYTVWNTSVIHHSLQNSAPGEVVYLSITPAIVAAILNTCEATFVGADEAVRQFADAVGEMYKTRVLPNSRRLETLRRCGADGLPECGAFLALSVLAAYRMHSDEGAAATAYYKRLDELLHCGIYAGLPLGFDGDDFRGLWVFFEAWLRREHGRSLAMPGNNAGPHRFIALPLTHVPLREVDIARLPTFFQWAGYTPGEHIATNVLATALAQWTRGYGGFTVAGNDAFADDRKAAVLSQVAQELTSWDGSSTDAQGRRTAAVEIFLHWRRRVPVLSYLPRRPAVFPATFDDGEHVLDAGQDGWYEPAEIVADDGSDLLNGFTWEVSAQGLTFALRRNGSDAIALAPSEFEGPVSHGALVMGAPCAVICADSVVNHVCVYLERITGKRCLPQAAPGIRSGWKLITDIRTIRRDTPPDGLDGLAVESNAEIIANGGLRLGSRRAWIAGAPPRLIATGVESSEELRLDDEAVMVDADGVIQADGRLTRPGSHVVQVCELRYRFEIVQPEVPLALADRATGVAQRPQYAVALRAGYWTIVGARQDEIAHAASGRSQRSILTVCTFMPVWAISVGANGALVWRLASPVPDPAPVHRRTAAPTMWPWANAIYAAHVRHPDFHSEIGALEPTPSAWMIYAGIAKNVKRALKARR
ncbi:MAG TPA: hypothetical protein VNA69_09600 [Thermoanaerobaculia bacterium]|nr:hypothetical protein [Thermoanaerobaculia bacterium]